MVGKALSVHIPSRNLNASGTPAIVLAFYLETFSFQAPSLYRSLGYEVKLELRGFSAGIVKYTVVRDAGVGEPPE